MPILAAAIALTAAPAAITITPGKTIPGLRPIAFAAAPTGSKFAASMEDGTVRIIDSKTGETVRKLGTHPGPAYGIAWSQDGSTIATGDETARIWLEIADSGHKVREYRTHTKGIQKLSFNIGKTMLISTGKDDQINVYDLNSDKPKEARKILGKGLNFYGAAFNPKLPYTFATGFLGTGGGRVYDANTGSVTGFITGHGGQGVFDVTYNPAGTRIVTAGRDATAIVWDPKGYKKLNTLKGHGDWVEMVAYSANGRLIATSSTDGTVKVWDAVSFKKLADIPQENAVGSPLCFTADGNTLVTTTAGGYLQFNKISPAQPGVSTPNKFRTGLPKKRRHRG